RSQSGPDGGPSGLCRSGSRGGVHQARHSVDRACRGAAPPRSSSVSEDKSTLQSIVGFFADLFQWTKEALIDDELRGGIIANLGLDPEQYRTVPPPNFDAHLDGIQSYRKSTNPDKEALLAAIADIKAVYEALRTYVEVLNDDSQFDTELTYQF